MSPRLFSETSPSARTSKDFLIPEPGKEEGTSVSELAERIKSLKAANSIEAATQRVRQKHAAAEEPVTARIRRRKEAIPALDSETQTDANAGATSPPASTQNLSAESPTTFQERIASERRRKDLEPSLP